MAGHLIGLLLQPGSDLILLEKFVREQGYVARILDEQVDGWQDVILLLVDESSARRHQDSLIELKRKRHMVPVLLVVRPSAHEAHGFLVQGAVDDVLRMPVPKPELASRLAMLLRLADQSRAALQQMERLFEGLEAFSYSVSHDLRAPLRSIRGLVEILLNERTTEFDEQTVDYLERIRGNTQKMSLLVEELLMLSRVERQPIKSEKVDISAMASQILSGLSALEPARRVEVSLTEGACAWGDPHLLQIALDNLFANAWKYSSHRDLARIELTVSTAGGTTTFCIRDNGVGFDPAYAERIFEPFQRLHTAEGFEGNGIGLTTVKRILRRHGGQVWAEAQPGHGANFYFTLPPNPC